MEFLINAKAGYFLFNGYCSSCNI